MTRRAAISALAVAFAAFAQARGEWVTEVVTNEYDGVEWLGSPNGECRIKCGILLSSAFLIDIDFMVTGGQLSSAESVFGSRTSSTSSDAFSMFVSDTGIFPQYYNIQSKVESAPVLMNVRYNYYGGGIGFWLNGVKIRDAVSATFTTPNEMLLFAKNQAGDGGADRPLYGRIYRCAVIDRNYMVKARNFIPVKDNGTPKMLDLVSGETFANSGTGSFTYGSITGKVYGVKVTRTYRPNPPMRSYDSAHPFNAPTARTRLGGTGSGEDGTTLRPTAHIAIKRNEED